MEIGECLMNKRFGCKFVLLLIGMILVPVLAACTTSESETPTAPLEPVTLKLDWRHGVQFLGFYVAQSQGYYADEGFDVTIDPVLDPSETSELPARLVSGEYDFALATTNNMRQAISENLSLTAFSAIYQFGPAALFARADTGIVTPEDLAGHSVVIKSPNWQVFVEGLLDHAGLTLADVEAVPGGFDMTPFIEGEVEVWAGYLTDEVIRARLLGNRTGDLPLI